MSVRSACSKGFRAYLAEQRQITMKASLSKGLVAGGLASGLFAIINRVAKLDADWYEVLAPFGLVAAGIVGHQAITANSADLEQKEAFDAVCSKYEEKEGE
jgi:hypothetical protein|tara:strand:+ start:383 stop:685 length:303 start_codon:yes stop_codon:yes gene_type:complete